MENPYCSCNLIKLRGSRGPSSCNPCGESLLQLSQHESWSFQAFRSQDIKQALVGPGSVALLLNDGTVSRVKVATMASPEKNEDNASTLEADQKELDKARRELAELQKRLTSKDAMVEKAKAQDYGYDDEHVDMMVRHCLCLCVFPPLSRLRQRLYRAGFQVMITGQERQVSRG